MNNKIQELIDNGILTLGKGVIIEEMVLVANREETNEGELRQISIGDHTIVRAGAIIYEGVTIGSDCRIGHGCILRTNASLGNNVVLSHHVIVEHDSKLGNWVRVSPHTHITSCMTVEDRAFLGAGVITVNDKFLTWKRNDREPNLLPPYVEFGARVGSGTTLLSGVRIGKMAMVGSGSVVTKDVPPYTIAFGNPAKVQRELDEEHRTPNGYEEVLTEME
ncbi:acyltransferase [Tumebacillus lipolyticus]|uniref:Acyltransferase n=1 Tax=Tumebacillus lipolyticus TaxID=1280370 RepID=A0ABW4ZYA3_9BACL